MAQASTDELLAQVPLFKDLPKKHLQRVASLATRIDAKPGRVLTKQDTIGNEFIVILDGEVEVRRDDEVISTRGPGDYVGEIALIEDRPRTATVVTTTPAVLDVISRREFAALLDDEPEIAEKIRATAGQRLAELDGSDPDAS